MSKKSKTVVKVSGIRNSRMIFIPRDLDIELEKGDNVIIEVNKDKSLTVKKV